MNHSTRTAGRHRWERPRSAWSIAVVTVAAALLGASACGSDDDTSSAIADPAATDDGSDDAGAEPATDDGSNTASAEPATDDGSNTASAEPATDDDGAAGTPSSIGPPGLDTSVADSASGFRGPDPSGQPLGMGVCTDSFVDVTGMDADRVDCTSAGSSSDALTVAVASLAAGGAEIWWFAGPSDSMAACARVAGTLQGLLDMSADGVATGIAVAVVADDGQAWPYVTIPADGCPEIDVPGELPEFTGPMPRDGGVFVRIDGAGVGEGVCYEPDAASGSWARRDGFATTC